MVCGLFVHLDQYWSALKGAHWFNMYCLILQMRWACRL